MSEPSFEQMYEWAQEHRSELWYKGRRASAEEIRRLYAEAHPKKVTAEDVAHEWYYMACNTSPPRGVPVSPLCEWSGSSMRDALRYAAQLEADRRNADAASGTGDQT